MVKPVQKLILQEATSKQLPTNLTAGRYPIHRWFNFIAGFSPEFVSQCLAAQSVRKGRLIDPFAGLSTSLVQARFEGIPSVGFETHPFFHDLSLAKLTPPVAAPDFSTIVDAGRSTKALTGDLERVWSEDALTYLAKLIPDEELRTLGAVMQAEDAVSPCARPLFRLIVSRTLEAVAHSQTDGIYKAPTTRKNSTPFPVAFERIVQEVTDDLPMARLLRAPAELHRQSSENMAPLADASCSISVTSPPYLNNFDFAEMTRMQLYFWRYAASWGEITETVRRNLIVNTTTVPTDLKRNQERYRRTLDPEFCEKLDPLVDALAMERNVRAGKKDYHQLVYPYFSQMWSVIQELRRVIQPGGPVHMVVADSALYGVHIKTDELLADLFRKAGFSETTVIPLRVRGDRWVLKKRQGPGGPLGEFHIHAR